MAERAAVQAVVLAGGDSERFGEDDKALADLDGRPGRTVSVLSVAV